MSLVDPVVCPVCRSLMAPGVALCATCGAPLAAPGAGGAGRGPTEVTGLPPGFPLWPVGEPEPGARHLLPPPPPAPPVGPTPPPPTPTTPAALPPGWSPPSPAAGPWGPEVPPPPEGWRQEPPPGWNQPMAFARPVSSPGDPADDEGWLPVSAAARGQQGAANDPGMCWNCGQRNGRNREYCTRCGQRLGSDLAAGVEPVHQLTPVSGGRGRRAVAFVWTVLVLALVVVVGVIAFGGFLPRDAEATPTLTGHGPTPTGAAGPGPSGSPTHGPAASLGHALATPVATSGPDTGSPVPEGTPVPLATPTEAPTHAVGPTPGVTGEPTPAPTATPAPTPTPAPTATPAPEPTAAPTPTLRPLSQSTPGPIKSTASPRAPAPATFECKAPVAIRDPLNRAWKLSGIYWAERADYDRVTLRLTPDADRGEAVSRVNVETMTLDQLALGLPAPKAGDVATVIRFSPGVRLVRALQGSPDKTALRSITALTAGDDRVYAVMGVAGRGCHAVQAPMWDDPSTQTTPFVDVTVDIAH